jgi:hypothetical protein
VFLDRGTRSVVAKGFFERRALEAQRIAATIICIGAPSAKIVSYLAEAQYEKVSGALGTILVFAKVLGKDSLFQRPSCRSSC